MTKYIGEAFPQIANLLTVGCRCFGENALDETLIERHEERTREDLAFLVEGLAAGSNLRQHAPWIVLASLLEELPQRGRRLENDREPKASQCEESPLPLAFARTNAVEDVVAQRLCDVFVKELDRWNEFDVDVPVASLRALPTLSLPLLLSRHSTSPCRKARREEGHDLFPNNGRDCEGKASKSLGLS